MTTWQLADLVGQGGGKVCQRVMVHGERKSAIRLNVSGRFPQSRGKGLSVLKE